MRITLVPTVIFHFHPTYLGVLLRTVTEYFLQETTRPWPLRPETQSARSRPNFHSFTHFLTWQSFATPPVQAPLWGPEDTHRKFCIPAFYVRNTRGDPVGGGGHAKRAARDPSNPLAAPKDARRTSHPPVCFSVLAVPLDALC